jgi:membrane protein implicated in regulation of membrane protease activity
MNSTDFKKEDLEKILSRLDSIEERISVLELNKEQVKQLQSVSGEEAEDDDSGFSDLKLSISAPFESNIGEYGLAWLGNIVLFFAIVFLWQYFNDAGKPFISLVVGGLSVSGVFIMSHYFRKSFTYLSFMFNLFGYIILYYIFLRLHFYNDKPLLTNWTLATVLLLIVVGVQFYFAVKKQSQLMAGLAFMMALFAAFVCNHLFVFFLISIGTTGLVMFSFWKYNWWKAMVFALCIGFLINLYWLLANPVSLIITPGDLTYHFAFIYFSIITAIYSLVTFRKSDGGFPDNLILAVLLLAGTAYSVILLALTFIHFPNAYVPFYVAISIYCVVYSVLLKLYSPWKYSPALYALFGFVAISVSIFGIYHFPDAFLLLIAQSFMVLALALWYRSYIITLMNTFLLVTLAVVYYNLSGTLQSVNFTIPAVAFLSARIINWQKERLNIKSDFIRNTYLFTLFFSMLYATYFGLPGQYITVSWLLIAGIYFGLSIYVKSIKYRWMAMGNLLVAAFYLFIVDLAKIDLIYRILIFLAFAVTTIVISTYYVKKLKEKDENINIT